MSAIDVLDAIAVLPIIVAMTALLGAAWGIARMARRNAALRHAILLAGLAAAWLTPFLAATIDAVGFPRLPIELRSAIPSLRQPPPERAVAIPRSDRVRNPNGVMPTPPSATNSNFWDRVWTIGLFLWLGGSLLRAAGFARSLVRLRGIVRRAQAVESASACQAAEAVRRKLSLRGPLSLWESGEVSCPIVPGLIARSVLLPRGLLAGLSQEELTAILYHEGAHLKRRDHFILLLQEGLSIALWWNPIVYLFNRELALAREEVCDNYVLGVLDRSQYSEALLRLARMVTPCQLLPALPSLWGTHLSLEHRVSSILDNRRPIVTRVSKLTICILAGACLAFSASAVVVNLAIAGGPETKKVDPAAADSSTVTIRFDLDSAGAPAADQPYRIAPPDVLMIDAVKLVPIGPEIIAAHDILQISVGGTPEDSPVDQIDSKYRVDSSGRVQLGPNYGTVKVAKLTLEQAAAAIQKHLATILIEPSVAVSLSEPAAKQQIGGEHLVGPDGRVQLGIYGNVALAGLTLEEAQSTIEDQLKQKGYEAAISLEVQSYNSQVYYVIVERRAEGQKDKDNGEQNTSVIRQPLTGNETVLDALSQASISLLGTTKVTLTRPQPEGGEKQLEVNWQDIVQGKSSATNYKLRSGDRLYFKEAGDPKK